MTDNLNHFNKLSKKIKTSRNASNISKKKQGRPGKESAPQHLTQIWSEYVVGI